MKKPPKPIDKKTGSVPLRNKKWELFCHLYSGQHQQGLFGNGTRCYIAAFGYNEAIERMFLDIEVILKQRKRGFTTQFATIQQRIKAKEKVAQVEAVRLLSKPIILQRCNFLMDILFSDEFMDRELLYVAGQRFDLPSKVAAIKEHNHMKGRVTEKLDLTLVGEPIDGIQIVMPAKHV